ncbi:hypothetical protein M011DRAFT_465683 [Sporormia fimetaria CBS 119925]|uniref:Uncharacterized protein n=1 Tax=Sporormia fimetaria CBS 119925 TaxID=1340428 RepID=A0A6A6VJQ3_9PLEO|nr:hypothetical protein M011DRAFT_465683 [Sporormia fimetaria CBS 119925]
MAMEYYFYEDVDECPYSDCNNPDHLFGIDPRERQSEQFRARWRHDKQPCCEFCDAFRRFGLLDLIDFAESPIAIYHEHWAIFEWIFYIHDFYKQSKNDDPRHMFIFRCMNELSHLIQNCWYIYKDIYPNLRLFARELTEMATELRTSRPRELYHTMAKAPMMLGWNRRLGGL